MAGAHSWFNQIEGRRVSLEWHIKALDALRCITHHYAQSFEEMAQVFRGQTLAASVHVHKSQIHRSHLNKRQTSIVQDTQQI